MRIAVVGAGPAGLYFAYLWRKRHPDAEVLVIEQNPAGATFGFGVVFSDRALDFLRADDPETADAIAPRILSLPFYPGLTEAQVDSVVAALKQVLGTP